MLVVLFVAAPSLIRILTEGGPLASASMDTPSRLGTLLIGFIVLTACFVVMLPVMLLNGLVLQLSEEPLLAHPAFVADGAVLRVVSAILVTSLFLLTFFCLFYARTLTSGPGVSGLSLAAHTVTAQLQLGTIGVFVAATLRRHLEGHHLVESSRRLQRLTVVPFLLLFPLAVVLPDALHKHFPEQLLAIGGLAPTALFFMQSPLAVPAALETGAWGSSALWVGALLLSVSLSLLVLWRWRREVLSDLSRVSDGQGCSGAPRTLPFPTRGPPILRQVFAFWAKDVVARRHGRVRTNLRFHGLLLFIAISSLFVGTGLPGGLLTEATVIPGPSQVLITVMAILSMVRTLGSLGEEGLQLGFLRTVLSVRRLFLLKALLNVGYALVHGQAYALALWLVARSLGVADVSLLTLLAEGALGGFTFALIGSALGFLLPDLRRRSLLLPGATRTSQLLFAAMVGPLIGAHLAVSRFKATSVMSLRESAGVLGVVVGLLLAVVGVLWICAIRKTQRMEA